MKILLDFPRTHPEFEYIRTTITSSGKHSITFNPKEAGRIIQAVGCEKERQYRLPCGNGLILIGKYTTRTVTIPARATPYNEETRQIHMGSHPPVPFTEYLEKFLD